MSTPHPGGPGGPPRGLSDRLKALERSQDSAPPPDFDLDAVVRGGRRRARRRTAASLVGTAAAVAAVVTTVSLSPLSSQHAPPPPAQHPTASATHDPSTPPTTPSTTAPAPTAPAPTAPTSTGTATGTAGPVTPGGTDTGYITDISAPGAATTTITVDRVLCDQAAGQSAQAVDQELCVTPGSDPGSEAGPQLGGEDMHITYTVPLAPDAVVIGSSKMMQVLPGLGGPGGTWFQQPMSERHLRVADLRTYLDSPDGHNTEFRLQVDARGRVAQVTEIYTP